MAPGEGAFPRGLSGALRDRHADPPRCRARRADQFNVYPSYVGCKRRFRQVSFEARIGWCLWLPVQSEHAVWASAYLVLVARGARAGCWLRCYRLLLAVVLVSIPVGLVVGLVTES